ALAPNFKFDRFFNSTGAPAFSEVNVVPPDFFQKVNGVVDSVSIDDWKTYLRWHAVRAAAPTLSDVFVRGNFSFYGQYLNGQKARAFEIKRNLNKIGKPLDKKEWGMTPPTVNAYYSSSNNDINFPAGILQPPFFDKDADDAVNFGGIGVVIGHELTHGFDDQGSKFDAEGNLKNWWTQADRDEFDKRT